MTTPETFETIVISGGGLKGLAAIGALTAFKDRLSLLHFYGTSVGSILCYLLALGYVPEEILLYYLEYPVLIQLDICENGFIDFEQIKRQLRFLTTRKLSFMPTFQTLFEATGSDLNCVAYNYTKNKMQVFNRKNTPNVLCLDAIQASSSVPAVFKKCIIEGDWYLDGGLVNNFPVDIAYKDHSPNILAIALDSIHNHKTSDALFTAVSKLSAELIVSNRMREQYFKYRAVTTIIYLNVLLPSKLSMSKQEIISVYLSGCVQAMKDLRKL